MRVVVMDEDMREPITVVEIPMYLMREVERRERRHITLAAPYTHWRPLPAPPDTEVRT